MGLRLICLMVHPDPSQVDVLTQKLWPEIQFHQVDRVESIADAFQRLADASYNICFVHGDYRDFLEGFFRDMQKLGRDRTCIFIQLWDKLPKNLDKTKAIELGFSDVISSDIAPDEREVLKEILKVEYHRQEVSRRVKDVGEAIGFLIKEVDRVAHEKSRGKQVSFDRLIRNFVAMQSEFDDEVMREYFEGLEEKTARSSPFDKKKVKIPESVIKRRLPHLSEDGYNGMSLRVWLKMLNKFGIPEDEKE